MKAVSNVSGISAIFDLLNPTEALALSHIVAFYAPGKPIYLIPPV